MFASAYWFNFGNLAVSLREFHKNGIKLQRPLESKINSFSFLKKLQFQNLDSVLKRQLNDKSFPVIRKNLWLASKKTANLGKRPVTYVLSTAIFNGKPKNVQNALSSFFVNNVFYVYQSVNCYSVNNLDTTKIQRFFVFAHTDVSLLDNHFTAENLKLFINPRIDSLYINKMNIDFNYVVKLKKYLQSLLYFDPLPNDWESILFNSETKFGHLCLVKAKVVDYESMRNFVNRQPPNFIWSMHDKSTINNQEFLKHFKPCGLENHDHGHDVPHLIHYAMPSEEKFYFCPIIPTASKTETPNKCTIVAE